jgi:nucleotide-binding universal stress UspA family protein
LRLPEPIVDRIDGTDPEHEALLADSVGLALLVVLETLSPAERLAFVLHDMFAMPFDEIARIVDRSPEAARQLASRARRRGRTEETVPDPDPEIQREAGSDEVRGAEAIARGGHEAGRRALLGCLPLAREGRRQALSRARRKTVSYVGHEAAVVRTVRGASQRQGPAVRSGRLRP